MGILTFTHVRGAHAGLKATILAFDTFKTKTNAEGCYNAVPFSVLDGT